MKKTYTKYFCDICGEEFDDSKELKTISTPCIVINIDEYGNRQKSFQNKEIEICVECLRKITTVEYTNRFYQEQRPGDIRIIRMEDSGL